ARSFSRASSSNRTRSAPPRSSCARGASRSEAGSDDEDRSGATLRPGARHGELAVWTPLTRTIAKHLRKPTGRFGRWVMVPALNRANAALNRAAFDLLDLRLDDRVLEVGFG